MSKDYTQGFSFGNMFKNLHKTDHSNAGQFFKNKATQSVEKEIKEGVVNYATNKVVDELQDTAMKKAGKGLWKGVKWFAKKSLSSNNSRNSTYAERVRKHDKECDNLLHYGHY